MPTTLSDLDSRVFLGLESAAEYLSLDDIHNVVVQRTNELTMQSRMSSVNVLLGVTNEFEITETPFNITSLIGKGVPCWLENRWINQTDIAWWRPIRVVPFSQLADYQALGIFAASFHGNEPNDDTQQATQYVSLTFLPAGVCRIRFDRDRERIELNANILLPDNLSEYVVLKSQNSLIPRIKNKIAFDLRRDKEGAKVLAPVLQTLSEIYLQNTQDMQSLDALWRVWAFRDRASETSFNLPTPNGQSLYPGNRNGNWLGGGWSGNN